MTYYRVKILRNGRTEWRTVGCGEIATKYKARWIATKAFGVPLRHVLIVEKEESEQ